MSQQQQQQQQRQEQLHAWLMQLTFVIGGAPAGGAPASLLHQVFKMCQPPVVHAHSCVFCGCAAVLQVLCPPAPPCQELQVRLLLLSLLLMQCSKPSKASTA
jgi:hypothetical protein